MKHGIPSRTAQRVAIRRAAHQVFDDPKVFEDPIALKIIGADEAARLRASRLTEITPPAIAMRAFMAARSRFAEDQLGRAIERGIRQYVVLGAGLDTFAYRNPHQNIGLKVFEVDFPATQEWKQYRLEIERIPIPPNLTFAPVDFERQTLDEGLQKAGFNLAEPAFFSWLGVTMYLSQDTVLSTLRLVHSLSSKSGIAFDYSVPRSSLQLLDRLTFDALARQVAKTGEPFKGFFEPSQLESELRGIGFSEVENLTGDDINARYFSGRSDNLRVRGRLGRLMSAHGV